MQQYGDERTASILAHGTIDYLKWLAERYLSASGPFRIDAIQKDITLRKISRILSQHSCLVSVGIPVIEAFI